MGFETARARLTKYWMIKIDVRLWRIARLTSPLCKSAILFPVWRKDIYAKESRWFPPG